MPLFMARYCGVAWYCTNAACQASCDKGGTTPVTGFHSVIESPDSVRRVAPPTSTMASTKAATA
jgi:hypothetical protein